jgi:hypothetical protein
MVLEAGVVRHQGSGAQLLADPEVARLYLAAAAASGLQAAPVRSPTQGHTTSHRE